jgi:hypothetical protein
VKEFNLSLLDKWCWRPLQETGGFWFMVLAAKYAIEDGRLIMEVVECLVGGKLLIVLGLEMRRVRGGVVWFGENIVRRVGDDERTLFWKDSWVDGTPPNVHFSRLFVLCFDKDGSWRICAD